jgi:3-oxoacyl-[acyl-carrier-protein] synthase-3
MLSIDDVSYFVPQQRFDVEASRERFSLSKMEAKVFATFYGLQKIPYAGDMSMVSLICKSIEQLLKKNNVERRNIKYIIHCHTATVITSFGRSVIREAQQALGLESALCFGTSMNNCASTLNALEMAEMLLQNHDKHARAILVTGERAFTPTVQVIPNSSITGDASAAALLGLNGKKHRMLSLQMSAAGEFHKGIWSSPSESKKFEMAYVPKLTKTINEAISKAGLTLNDIALIVPHNVNVISWLNYANESGFPYKKIFLSNVKKYAHCFGSDIFINLSDAVSKNRISPGDYYVMATVGIGATFGACIFQY